MAQHFSQTTATQLPTIRTPIFGAQLLGVSPKSDCVKVLKRIIAQLAYLADEARQQRKHQLEAALLKTAAELLTSMTDIAAAGYAAALIERLTTRVQLIEENLLSGKSPLRHGLPN